MPRPETQWGIVFYQDRRGRNPALDFTNDFPVVDQAKIYNALRLLREFGSSLGMPHTRHVDRMTELLEDE